MASKQSKLNKQGLSEAEAKSQLKKFGLNEIKLTKSKNWLVEFLKEFTEIFSIILILAAALAFFAKEQVDAIIILSIIVINSLISFVQKYKADKAVESLQP